MIDSLETGRKVPLLKRLSNKIKYGLILDSIRHQVSRIGIKIIPYYWVQEGMNSIP